MLHVSAETSIDGRRPSDAPGPPNWPLQSDRRFGRFAPSCTRRGKAVSLARRRTVGEGAAHRPTVSQMQGRHSPLLVGLAAAQRGGSPDLHNVLSDIMARSRPVDVDSRRRRSCCTPRGGDSPSDVRSTRLARDHRRAHWIWSGLSARGGASGASRQAAEARRSAIAWKPLLRLAG